MNKNTFLFILSHLSQEVADNLKIRKSFVVHGEICRMLDKISEDDFKKLIEKYEEK